MHSFYIKLLNFIEAFQSRRFWKLYLVAICCVYCVLSNVTKYKNFIHGHARDPVTWNWLDRQITDPFMPQESPDIYSHHNKMAFRLTPVFIGKIIPSDNQLTRIRWLFLVQNLMGVGFFFLLISFAENALKSKFLSFMLPVFFTVIYAGKTFFWDHMFLFDGMAYFFLLLSVCTRKWWLVMLSLILAFFTDERALVGSGFVFLIYVIMADDFDKKLGWKLMVSVLAAIPVYGIIRLLLGKFTGIYTVTTDIGFTATASVTPFGYFTLATFTAFKGYWLLFIMALFYLKGYKQYGVFIITTLTVILGGLTIFDFTRSISYGFIGILAILYRFTTAYENKQEMQKLLLVLFAVSALDPLYNIHWQELFISNPIMTKFYTIPDPPPGLSTEPPQ